MDMKKIKIILILCIVMLFVSSMVSVMAVSAYLYNSNEVSYNNNASGITSSNVQGAIDELYEHATDYTNMNTRVSALEGYFKNNPTSYFEGSALRVGINSSSNSSLILYKNGTKRLQLWPYESSDQAGIQAYASDGTTTGPLNLIGNPIRINGTSINDYFVVETKTLGTDTSLSTGFIQLSFNISKSGYTPIGIVGYNLNNRGLADKVLISAVLVDGTSNASIYGQATTNVTVYSSAYVNVLYRKS